VTIADAVCYAYEDQGHMFYVMNFPTAQKTWIFDAITGLWHERGYWNQQGGVFTQTRAGFHTFNFGIHLVGDPTTGLVYQQSIAIYSDNGNPIRRLRRSPHTSNEQSRIFHTELQVDVEVGLGPSSPGKATPVNFPMLDAAGNLRQLKMGENGILQAPLFPTGDPSTAVALFLNDTPAAGRAGNTTSWQIVINAEGEISPQLLPAYFDSYPQIVPFVSVLGDQYWNLQVENLGGGIAVLQTVPLGIVEQGPLMMMRYSNDSAKTWSDEQARDCGQAGETQTRVIWRRLGQARDRVYEISMTAPVPWRIIDAYLFTDPADRDPSERYNTTLRKRA
jgi:hypothetical protein